MTRVALVDMAGGNLHSARKALQRLGADVVVTSDPAAIATAARIVLPGDGAFPAAMRALDAAPGLRPALEAAVRGRGVPFLGICVGMQLLATMGHEHGMTPGLGWIDGDVVAIKPGDPALRVPQMGWNDLEIVQQHPLLAGIATGDHAYFVHSWRFAAGNPQDVRAQVDHGGQVTAVVARGNIAGCQFHPEKSHAVGLRLLDSFLGWTP